MTLQTSVKINSGREEVIDFSVPFLEVSLTSSSSLSEF